MTNQDKIKRRALDKLDKLVKEELDYLKKNDRSLKDFKCPTIDSSFSEEELKEIAHSLEQLKSIHTLRTYCHERGIESDLFDKIQKTSQSVNKIPLFMKKNIISLLLCLLSITLFAQNNDVTLIVCGEGATKTDATQNALRSAIEQALGTFVSSNTEILNDSLVKDEIATVTSGNIKNYREISYSAGDNKCLVNLSVTVSPSNLINYVQSHGGQTELAGKAFAAQMKMEKLNIENEKKALNNMIRQLYLLLPDLFNYSIKVSNPKMISTEEGEVDATVFIEGNKNTKNFYQIIKSNLSSLSVPQNANIPEKHEVVFDGEIYWLRTTDWLYYWDHLVSCGIFHRLFGFKILTQNERTQLGYIDFFNDFYIGRYFNFYCCRRGYIKEFMSNTIAFNYYPHSKPGAPKHKLQLGDYEFVEIEYGKEKVVMMDIDHYYSISNKEILPFKSPFQNNVLNDFSIKMVIPIKMLEEIEVIKVSPIPYKSVVVPFKWSRPTRELKASLSSTRRWISVPSLNNEDEIRRIVQKYLHQQLDYKIQDINDRANPWRKEDYEKYNGVMREIILKLRSMFLRKAGETDACYAFRSYTPEFHIRLYLDRSPQPQTVEILRKRPEFLLESEYEYLYCWLKQKLELFFEDSKYLPGTIDGKEIKINELKVNYDLLRELYEIDKSYKRNKNKHD